MEKTIAVVGLGLIGGSLAKAFHAYTDYRVIGFNRTRSVAERALAEGVIDEIGTEENISEADVIMLSLYPELCVDFIRQHTGKIKKGCIITDACGVKAYLDEHLSPLARENHAYYVGMHPMAGREFSGYDYADENLFEGASMVVVPTQASTEYALREMEALSYSIGFGRVVFATPEEHDSMIAFTSQMPHVVSNAFVKSPSAVRHKGFSAGSYKDLTRVARLNEGMWTELFLENREPLLAELNGLIERLGEYRDAIQKKDADALRELLRDGSERKKSIDSAQES